MNNCLMSRLYMQPSAFAWHFFLYCKILLIPVNRINRKNTKWGKTYVWYVYHHHMTIIFILETMSHFSTPSFCDKLQPFELASAILCTTSMHRLLTTTYKGLLALEEHCYVNIKMARLWSMQWKDYPTFFVLREVTKGKC